MRRISLHLVRLGALVAISLHLVGLSALVAILTLGWSRAGTAGTADAQVELLKAPNGGIQPQAAIDGKGVLHLVYLKGDPGASDVYYVHRGPGKEGWSAPIRVNSRPGSAMAIGT